MINNPGEIINGIELIDSIGKNKFGIHLYMCKCHCGKIFEADIYKIRKNNSSCGCLTGILRSRAHRMEYGVAAINDLIRDYKNKARKRKIEYNLSRDEFLKLTNSDCYYCGIKPSQIKKVKTRTASSGEYIYNGIDRIDSNKNYEIDNCVSCCKYCNFAKNDLSIQDFFEQIKMIYNKLVIDKNLIFELNNNEIPITYKKFESKFALFVLPYGVSSINQCMHHYRKSAKYRNLEFSLSRNDFFNITTSDCHYCNTKPCAVYKNKNNNGDFIHNGIDRVDNEIGYTINNCVACCKRCNQIKAALTMNQFIELVTRIYNKHIK